MRYTAVELMAEKRGVKADRIIRVGGLALSVSMLLLLSSCASKLMTSAPERPAAPAPAPDKATVVFMRPTHFGGAIQSSVFDISSEPPPLVGIVSMDTKVAYVTTPGTKRFMVIGETADFMDATLNGGKTYYARITPRMGWWKARFSLEPITKSVSESDLNNDLQSCSWVENSPASLEWAQTHMASIQDKKAKSLPDWLSETDKPTLVADDGR